MREVGNMLPTECSDDVSDEAESLACFFLVDGSLYVGVYFTTGGLLALPAAGRADCADGVPFPLPDNAVLNFPKVNMGGF